MFAFVFAFVFVRVCELRWGLGLRCGAWVANKPGGEAWGGRSAKEQSLLDREWNTTAFVEQYLECVQV